MIIYKWYVILFGSELKIVILLKIIKPKVPYNICSLMTFLFYKSQHSCITYKNLNNLEKYMQKGQYKTSHISSNTTVIRYMFFLKNKQNRQYPWGIHEGIERKWI